MFTILVPVSLKLIVPQERTEIRLKMTVKKSL